MSNPCVRLAWEAGHLKQTPRAGWAIAGAPGRVESVADHSHRVSILAGMIAVMEEADPSRAALVGTWHDVPETRLGDIPHVGRRYLTATDAETVVRDQVDQLPPAVARLAVDAVVEFEQQATAEARCAKDADKLDCLLQALEYQRAGARDVDNWIDTSRASLRTATGNKFAEDAVADEHGPGSWWKHATGKA